VRTSLRRFAPAACVLAVSLAYLGWVLVDSGGDPLAFATLGTRFSAPDPAGSEGYDGQFSYFIAVDPDPQTVRAHLDEPAYRYQRILYPLLARALALGSPQAIPWTLPIVNLICLTTLTFLAGELLAGRGASRWAAVPIGLWAGLLGSVRLDLSEPLALLLAVAAIRLAGTRLEGRILLAAMLLAPAMLAKETMLPFILGWAAWLAWRRNFRKAALILAALAPFGLFQIWLRSAFGAFGVGSGGAGATAFEWIPFLGLARIAEANARAFALLLIVYLPGLLIPAVYGLVAPFRDLARKALTPEGALLFFNALMVALAPYSTFREPLGILRLACGLIFSVWLYAAAGRKTWWLKLGLAGLAYLPFVLQ
jgi:hypothetical protein